MRHSPAERVFATRIFAEVALEFGGPICTKLTRTEQDESHVALFVCVALKAIQIELVSSLSTVACIAALRSFTTRLGLLIATVLFHCARNELSAPQETLVQKSSCSLASYLSIRRVTWLMIPPRAPHFDSLWEGAIRSCKNLLRKVIGKQALPFEELYTVLTQVEATLSSRPLSFMSFDPIDLEILTPVCFIIGRIKCC